MKIILEITKEEIEQYLSDGLGELKLRIIEMTPENHIQVKKHCKLCKGKCISWRPTWTAKYFKVIQILP